MQKSFLTWIEVCFISFWVYFFSLNSEYYLSDPNFWFRINNTICSYLSYVLTRGPKSNEELEIDSNSFYEMITGLDLGWVVCLWLLRFQLPRGFVADAYTVITASLESI
jgi:hypothetical protein